MVIDERLERAATEAFASFDLNPMVLHDNPSRRLVAHFGVSYDAATRTATGDAPPIPDVIWELVTAAATALDAQDLAFEEVLATRYPPGSGIGRHRDAPGFGTVLGVSLLSPCELQFERGSGTDRRVWEQYLPPRSAYLLMGPARWEWRHGISSVSRERMSITARELRDIRR